MSNVSSVYYPEIKRFDHLSDVFVWQRQTFCADGTWYNGPTENGIIVSPYAKLKLNGRYVPVYAARAAFSTHSFAYAEVEGDAYRRCEHGDCCGECASQETCDAQASYAFAQVRA